MGVKSWNNILSLVVVFQALLTLTEAEDIAIRSSDLHGLNVTTSLQDYITQTDRQYAEELARCNGELSNFRTNFESQMDFIYYNKDLVEAKLVETDKKLYPLEFLDETSKYCVQKYSSLLFSIPIVRSSFLSCINVAKGALNTILSYPQSTQTVLNNYYNNNWKNGLAECARKNIASYHNHTICVMKLIESSNTYFNNNGRNFINQMEDARCSADSRIRQTIQCGWTIQDKASASIGEVNRLVEHCMAGVGSCKPCLDQSHNNTITNESECRNVIDIYTNTQTYRNATIENPFYGMNSTMDCILVNFIKPA